jgi:hypothetical protein
MPISAGAISLSSLREAQQSRLGGIPSLQLPIIQGFDQITLITMLLGRSEQLHQGVPCNV